jgi:tetratricopeptide (TPR) repeat protein
LKALYKYLSLTGLLLLAISCSVEKNTATTRFYHGLTARYNIFFNGNESFKAGVAKVEANHVDDYAQMLRLFEYNDPASASICRADMDNAITKASKLIRLKSITALPEQNERDREGMGPDEALLNRKEYNDWVDDAYLLIGKANFYKQIYDEAYAVFSYCMEQANDENIRLEAAIWNARVYIEKGDFVNAGRYLNDISVTGNLPKNIREMYYTTQTDLFIKQKMYADAIAPLERAVKLARGKREKYRYTFLLAQLNQETGNDNAAVALYRKVIKMSPPYEVKFNAQINTATAIDALSNDIHSTRRTLERMMKDANNTEYHDQIYYALGNLAIKEKNIEEAIGFFRKSVAVQSSNTNQKSRSYLALAEYFYDNNDLIRAGTYYDSAAYFLNESHNDYKSVKSMSENLNAVVDQLRIIQEQDSLQRIAAMSETERTNYINNIIAAITEAERAASTPTGSDQYNLGQFYENERRFSENIEQEGNWYFYNQTALTFGRTEFRRLYGNRVLEDNWRRSNKTTVNIAATSSGSEPAPAGNTNGSGTESGGTAPELTDNKKPEYYLRNLPLSDSLLAISNDKIANAYLRAGIAYSEKFEDPVTATEYLEMLAIRFPGNKLEAEAFYHLYQINKTALPTKAETYKQRLLQKYPETEYAKILSDPDYFRRQAELARESTVLYERAYNTYLAENFDEAVSLCEEGMVLYADDSLAPKFMLLRAYCYARIADERTYKEELNRLITAFPGTEESRRAAEIVAYLNAEIPELFIEEEREIASEIYVKDLTRNHMFVVVIENPAFNINVANFDVISYNIDNYTNSNFRTQGELIGGKYVMITVSGFSDYTQALDYYSAFNETQVIRNPSSDKIYSFLIDSNNLATLNDDKNPERYYLFFRDNYLP